MDETQNDFTVTKLTWESAEDALGKWGAFSLGIAELFNDGTRDEIEDVQDLIVELNGIVTLLHSKVLDHLEQQGS